MQSYEYNVLYYDQWFAEITPEEMQFIKDKGAAYLEGLGTEQKPSPHLLTGPAAELGTDMGVTLR